MKELTHLQDLAKGKAGELVDEGKKSGKKAKNDVKNRARE